MIYINRLGQIVEGQEKSSYIYIKRSQEGFGNDFFIFSSKNRSFESEVFDSWVQNEIELLAFIHQYHWQIEWLNGSDVNPGENIYPDDWTSYKILEIFQDAYTSPSLTWKKIAQKGFSLFPRSERFYTIYQADNVELNIVSEPQGGGMITAYPLKGSTQIVKLQ